MTKTQWKQPLNDATSRGNDYFDNDNRRNVEVRLDVQPTNITDNTNHEIHKKVRFDGVTSPTSSDRITSPTPTPINNEIKTEEPQRPVIVSPPWSADRQHKIFILSFVLPTILICGIIGIVQLSLTGYFLQRINSDPNYLNDPNALTIPRNCTLIDVRVDCAERGRYLNRGEHCNFLVTFPSLASTDENPIMITMESLFPYSLIDNSVYSTMKNNDTVICYVNKKETQVNVYSPHSPLYEAYYLAGGVLGVFGSISVAAAICVIPTAFVRPKNRFY
ncbi:hypothetical protein ABK040_015679 [Willaertia magna]